MTFAFFDSSCTKQIPNPKSEIHPPSGETIMHEVEIVLGLLLLVAVLVLLAEKIKLPYPILLVIGGLAIGFIPGLPRIEVEPELIFLLFLPPIIQSAAYQTSIRDFKANFRSIMQLAIALPILTTVVVAVIAHIFIQGFGWAESFVLGAIVSPPDAVSATVIGKAVGLPRRVVTVLEGESLLNDATALVAYKLAVVAVVTGVFSFGEAGFRFLLTAGGGVLIGAAIGWLAVFLFKNMQNPPIEITLQLLSGYGAYLAAEAIGASGVVAVVALGFIFGYMGPTVMSSETRIQALSVWEMLIFLLNGLIFILIGLQLPTVVEDLADYNFWTLIIYGAAITLTVILVRLIWMPFGAWVPRIIINRIKGYIHEPLPPWQAVAVTAWAGMRGMVSLAAALALPTTANGQPFVARDLIIFITFMVILITLVGQGLSLPFIVRKLKVYDDGSAENEERNARRQAAEAAVKRLEELANESWAPSHLVEDLRVHYRERQRTYSDDLDGAARAQLEKEEESFKRLHGELLQVERSTLIRLRDEGAINDEVLRQVERDLDLSEQGLRR